LFIIAYWYNIKEVYDVEKFTIVDEFLKTGDLEFD